MKKNILHALVINLLGFCFFIPNLSFAHDGESRVSVELESESTQAGDVVVVFQLIDLVKKTLLEEKDLEITHEKKLHVFFFDPALREFRHEHPIFSDSKWRLSTHLPVNGKYWIWAQGKILADGSEFSGSSRIQVSGGLSENPLPTELGNVRVGLDGLSKAVLSENIIHAKKMVMLDLVLSRTDGSKPQITPFLGANAHVIAVTFDGDSLPHVHPMDMSDPTQLMIHAIFPAAGDYRVWIQFMDAGELKTVPLSVTVQP